MPSPTPPAVSRGRLVLIGLLVLVGALLVRYGYASSKSLVLDEFHSLYHATHGPADAFFAALRRDNHPPLSFLLIGTSADALGTSELALRLPALLASLLEIVLVVRLTRRLGGSERAALAAAVLLGLSTMHVDYGTQARMYAPFALAITVSVLALVALVSRSERPRGAQVAFTLGAACAFHLHYFTAQYLGLLVPAAAVGAWASGEGRRALRLVAPTLGAALLCLPWALLGLREQLGHGLPPGGDDLGLGALLQAFVHLFFHNVSLGGELGRWAFVAAAALVLGLGVLGALAVLRTPSTRAGGVVVVTAAFVVPVAAWGAALLAPRAGFTWHYLLPSAASAAALAGIGAFGALRRTLALPFVGVALLEVVLVALHLGAPATEDFRGAVRFALERADHADPSEDVRLVAVEWQPPLFPQGRPYDYYAPRLTDGDPPPRTVAPTGSFVPTDLPALLGADRVVVVRRSLPDGQPLVTRLTERFGAPTSTPFGFGLDVLEFGPAD